jgi:Domain of unknown function (DUF4062)
MISSTILDLPLHRGEVEKACLQQEMFPDMMENLAASDSNAVRVSLEKVDNAEIYLGIFGHRYGCVPDGYTTSITEMEYDRALQRGISRLVFIMHDGHLITIGDVDVANFEKLRCLKTRLLAENTVNFFKSPDDLRGLVVNSLSHYRYDGDKMKLKDAERLSLFVKDHEEISGYCQLKEKCADLTPACG